MEGILGNLVCRCNVDERVLEVRIIWDVEGNGDCVKEGCVTCGMMSRKGNLG